MERTALQINSVMDSLTLPPLGHYFCGAAYTERQTGVNTTRSIMVEVSQPQDLAKHSQNNIAAANSIKSSSLLPL